MPESSWNEIIPCACALFRKQHRKHRPRDAFLNRQHLRAPISNCTRPNKKIRQLHLECEDAFSERRSYGFRLGAKQVLQQQRQKMKSSVFKTCKHISTTKTCKQLKQNATFRGQMLHLPIKATHCGQVCTAPTQDCQNDFLCRLSSSIRNVLKRTGNNKRVYSL